MLDIWIKLLLALVELSSEGAVCDVWINDPTNRNIRYCRRLRSAMVDSDS